MKVCKKCQSKKEFTGSGLCNNKEISCDLSCDRCIHNSPCKHCEDKQ